MKYIAKYEVIFLVGLTAKFQTYLGNVKYVL